MNSNKRDFILAGSIFVAMAIVGTAFGLWFVTSYLPQRAPDVVTPAR